MFKLQNKTILISRTESGILQVKRKQGTMEEFAGTINELKIYHKELFNENNTQKIFKIKLHMTKNFKTYSYQSDPTRQKE